MIFLLMKDMKKFLLYGGIFAGLYILYLHSKDSEENSIAEKIENTPPEPKKPITDILVNEKNDPILRMCGTPTINDKFLKDESLKDFFYRMSLQNEKTYAINTTPKKS